MIGRGISIAIGALSILLVLLYVVKIILRW
jgi:hypothetical protein